MSRHFLFCLPVRFGVFILSLFGFLGNALTAFGIFFQLRRLDSPPKSILIPAIVYGSIAAICSLLSLLGFFGSIFRNRRLVKAFAWAQTYQLGVYIATGVFYIVFLFTNRDKIERDCLKALDKVDNADDICHDLSSTNRYIFLAVFIVQIFIQFYLIHITRSYVRQLEETSYKALQTSRGFPTSTLFGNQPRSSVSGDRVPATPSGPMPSYHPIMNPGANSSRTGLVTGERKEHYGDEKDDLERADDDGPYSSPYQVPYTDKH
ncbi:hypothetical protein BT69DRAFT_1280495 [Atractiella rhizophila]|nr:hypothetical protein BT69DRAFT_1280495 [Atractiella rhizophila]